MTSAALPTIFLSHGGGPCFWITPRPPLAPDAFDRLARYFEGIIDSLPARPRAILVVTGHWEADVPTFATDERPGMLFDYYNFPPHTYALAFPAPGAPALAARAADLLAAAGIGSARDDARGYDHGVFVPMLKVLPDADISVLAMSICADMDPARHVAIGRALAPLRREGVLILGSGLSFHNLRTIFDGRPGEAVAWNDWLVDAVTEPDAGRRDARLAGWAEAPGARMAHPREDHLIPLMVVAGAAGLDVGRLAFADTMANKPVSGFQFG